jgi:hypothetical protein
MINLKEGKYVKNLFAHAHYSFQMQGMDSSFPSASYDYSEIMTEFIRAFFLGRKDLKLEVEHLQ